MTRKYFPFDKNYLLEQAQLSQQKELTLFLIDYCKKYYLDFYNPLGIVDATILAIEQHETEYTSLLDNFYNHCCGVYRYKHGEIQLEFLFDGKDHYTKYKTEWKNAFESWVKELATVPYFLRAVLELAVFFPKDRRADLAANRMKAYLEQHFQIKVYRYKGIMEVA